MLSTTSRAAFSPAAECGHARQLFDAKHILWITFIPHTLSLLYCSICSARIVRFRANIEIFSLSTAEIILFLSPIDVDRADGRQSVARKLYPREGREIRVFEKRPQSNGIAKREAGVSQDITSRFPFIRRLSRHSLFLSLFSAGAHLFAIVCCSRFCLICPSTRITRRSSSPRREFLYPDVRREYLETLQFSRASPLTYVFAQEEDRPSLLWPCRGKSEAITLGFYLGLPRRREKRGRIRSVANKRMKRRAMVEWRDSSIATD